MTSPADKYMHDAREAIDFLDRLANDPSFDVETAESLRGVRNLLHDFRDHIDKLRGAYDRMSYVRSLTKEPTIDPEPDPYAKALGKWLEEERVRREEREVRRYSQDLRAAEAAGINMPARYSHHEVRRNWGISNQPFVQHFDHEPGETWAQYDERIRKMDESDDR